MCRVCFTWTDPIPLDASTRAHLLAVFVDTFLTTFFVSGGLLPQRIRDVQFGRLPLVHPMAFPSGCVLNVLYPRGPRVRGRPPTRQDHCANLCTWFSIIAAWTILWGGTTFLALAALWASPWGGPAHESFCISPLTYLIVRASWSGLQGVLVASGAYILWCTRGERPTLLPSAREPLSPALSDVVVVN